MLAGAGEAELTGAELTGAELTWSVSARSPFAFAQGRLSPRW